MKTWCLILVTVAGVAAVAGGDTFKLRDGATVEGMIASESASEYVVDIEYAGGTITRQEHLAKSNVVELVRLTAEQLMEREFAATQRYRLDPQVSFPVEFYSQVISNSFAPFLRKYPGSVHAPEVTGKIQEWELERELVATGQARFGGKWISATEAAKQSQRERVRRLVQQGKGYLAQRWYESAIAQLHAAGRMTDFPELATEARHREVEAYRLWLEALGAEQKKLEEDMQRAQQNTQAAHANVQQRQTALQHLRSQAKNVHPMGQSGFELQKSSEISSSEADVTFKQQVIENIRVQQEQLAKKIADVQARAGTVSPPAAVAVSSPTTVAIDGTPRATAAPLKAPDVLETIVHLVKTYWIAFTGVFLLVVWGILRSLTN